MIEANGNTPEVGLDLLPDHHGHETPPPEQDGSISGIESVLELPRPALCRCHRLSVMRLNLRGVRFVIPRQNLRRKSTSRLSLLTKSDPSYDTCYGEYCFDRNPAVFNSVLDYYAYGEMHLPANICIQAFRKELLFWQLEPELLAPCCWSKYRKAEEEEKTLVRVQKEWGSLSYQDPTVDELEGNSQGKIPTMQRIWLFMNEPHTSQGAKVSTVNM